MSEIELSQRTADYYWKEGVREAAWSAALTVGAVYAASRAREGFSKGQFGDAIMHSVLSGISTVGAYNVARGAAHSISLGMDEDTKIQAQLAADNTPWT